MTQKQLEELLMARGLITRARLDAALADLGRTPPPRRLSALLVDRGEVSARDLARLLSQELSVPWVSLARTEPSRSVRALVPRDVAERFCLAPVYVRRELTGPATLFVAIDDPTCEEALLTASVFAGMPVRPVVAPRDEIRAAIARWYHRRSADERPTIPAPKSEDLDELYYEAPGTR